MPMRLRSSAVVLSIALAACGGGLFAVLPFVAAIGGFWQGGTQGNGFWDVNPDESIDFVANNDLFAPAVMEYPADFSSRSTACGPANNLRVAIRIDGQSVALSVPGNAALANCLRGAFVDEITLRLDTGGAGTLYRNATVAPPQFELGVWQNIDRPEQRLRFANPSAPDPVTALITQTGCELSNGVRSGTLLMRYTLGDPAADPRLRIESLQITRGGVTETLGPGRMFGLSGAQLTQPGGGTLSLQRLNESPTC